MQNLELGVGPQQFEEWLAFKGRLINLWDILRQRGIAKPHITDKNYPRFMEMTPAQRTVTGNFIVKQVEIYNEAEEFGVEFGDTPELLKVALRVMGMGVDKGLFDLLKRDDVVELYSVEHLQLFRSFNFFQLCNYNLDDILMYEWFNLYERADTDTTLIFNQVIGHLNATECITPFDIPKHLMKERFSDQQGVFEIELKHLASAFKGPGQREGYVASQRVKVLDVVDRGRVEMLQS